MEAAVVPVQGGRLAELLITSEIPGTATHNTALVPVGIDGTPQPGSQVHSINTSGSKSETLEGGSPVQTNVQIVVHYTVPDGQRFLPVYLGQDVTMVQVGMHGDFHVYEPTNTYLNSFEEGLRCHRSMNESDV